MNGIGVNCTFKADGSVQVWRVQMNGRWQAVEQGRQWQDQNGRHVLIMFPGERVHELLLSRHSLAWELLPPQGRPQIV